ncbi:MAG TPA: DUF4153 domain-containing protein [Clostridiales bacterium]|nr:DUF4153 domain-containing protein [Clostridiales bacterium]
MKLLKLLKDLVSGLYASVKRFPVTIGLTSAVSILLIIITQNESNFTNELRDSLNRIAMILTLGAPLSLCIKLAFEKYENVHLVYKATKDREKANQQVSDNAPSEITSHKIIAPKTIAPKTIAPKTIAQKAIVYRILAYIFGAGALVLYYFFLLPNFSMVSISRYLAFSIALYLGFFFIPYLPNRSDFELYVIKILSRFFITLIYSAVLYGGLAAIMFTLDKLLSVPIQSRYYYYVWLIIAGVFAPSYFLAGLPASANGLHVSSYPKALKILLLYIVMPIITAYTLILYTYFAKIIITLQWPVGLVAHLVIWYSVISTGVIFLVSPLVNENKWVKNFTFWFIKLIIPVMIMMFVAIGIRLKAYGITENRYFLVVLGSWVLGIMIYISFTNAKKNIILPVSLALIAVLAVSGPWSSYSVSKFSQNKRLENILTRNGMLKDDQIMKNGIEVPDTDKIEISQIITYFERNHKLSDVKYLPSDFKMENFEYVLGFPYTYNAYERPAEKFFAYSSYDWSKPVDIGGYDYLIDSRGLYSETELIVDSMRINYDFNSTSFRILYGDDEIYGKTLSDFGTQLFYKYGTTEKQKVNPDDMYFVEENDKVKLKFVFMSVYGEKDSSAGNARISSMEFYILIKLKGAPTQ